MSSWLMGWSTMPGLTRLELQSSGHILELTVVPGTITAMEWLIFRWVRQPGAS